MGWTDWAKYLQDYGWLPLAQVFILLPLLYCVLAIQTHKDYADLVKGAPASFPLENSTLTQIEDDLRLFDLDWWLVVAIAALFAGLLASRSVATLSLHFDKLTACPTAAAVSADSLQRVQVTSTSSASVAATANCEQEQRFVRTALSIYAMAVGMGLVFILGWGRVSAVKKLRAYHLKFRARPTHRHMKLPRDKTRAGLGR